MHYWVFSLTAMWILCSCFTTYWSVDSFRRRVVIMTHYGFLETDNFSEMDTLYISLTWDM